MASDDQGPAVRPFSYVHVPADDAEQLSAVQFDGENDDELRTRLRRFFSKFKYTEGARSEMREHLLSKVEEKNRANVSSQMLDQLNDDDGAFEIVPVVLPSRYNRFTAVSLYIDDRGRFKDLPLNSRASKVAQRDIRGDAFLLSNHDDPALDTWERVDTTVDQAAALIAAPPQAQLDTGNKSQMLSAAAARDGDTVVVSAEAAAEALEIKAAAAAKVAEGNWEHAAAMYGAATEKLRGRTDLLPNDTELTAARTACMLNLALCGLKLGRWDLAASAAAQALMFEPTNPKGWFRLASAQIQQREFEEADKSITRCEEHNVPSSDVAMLRAGAAQGRAAFEQEQRKRYSKMFS